MVCCRTSLARECMLYRQVCASKAGADNVFAEYLTTTMWSKHRKKYCAGGLKNTIIVSCYSRAFAHRVTSTDWKTSARVQIQT